MILLKSRLLTQLECSEGGGISLDSLPRAGSRPGLLNRGARFSLLLASGFRASMDISAKKFHVLIKVCKTCHRSLRVRFWLQ